METIKPFGGIKRVDRGKSASFTGKLLLAPSSTQDLPYKRRQGRRLDQGNCLLFMIGSCQIL